MLIITPRITTKKITEKIYSKKTTKQLKWYTRKFQLNTKGSNGDIEKTKRN